MISRNVRKVREGASKSACARPRKPPARSIALRRLPDIGAHRRERQAVRRARLVRHPSGATAWRTRKAPAGYAKTPAPQASRKGWSPTPPLSPTPFFSSPAWRAISRGPKGPFRVRRSGKARQGQGRCGAHGEAKPQAVRRRAYLGSPQGDPPPAGFRGRAQAPLPLHGWHHEVAGLARRGGRSGGQGWQV